jgi:hypothetical protein
MYLLYYSATKVTGSNHVIVYTKNVRINMLPWYISKYYQIIHRNKLGEMRD